MTEAQKRERLRHVATVSATEWLSPSMVRVVFSTTALDGAELFADSYVKLLFDGVQRAYTVRAHVPGEFTVDFVVHGDEGLAGPWATHASPGDQLEFVGPGGEWSPRMGADLHLFIGDESALPAIASGLERLGGARSLVFVEIGGAGEEYPLPGEVTWVRGDRIGMAFDRLIDPQAARKPVSGGDNALPAYLRPLPRVGKFGR